MSVQTYACVPITMCWYCICAVHVHGGSIAIGKSLLENIALPHACSLMKTLPYPRWPVAYLEVYWYHQFSTVAWHRQSPLGDGTQSAGPSNWLFTVDWALELEQASTEFQRWLSWVLLSRRLTSQLHGVTFVLPSHSHRDKIRHQNKVHTFAPAPEQVFLEDQANQAGSCSSHSLCHSSPDMLSITISNGHSSIVLAPHCKIWFASDTAMVASAIRTA